MPAFSRNERRKSMAERRPSTSYSPSIIPHLDGLERPNKHSLNIDHCDILILGTGLVELILAAALAWQGVEVLHIDRNNYYGDLSSTLTIDQLKKWCVEVNHGTIRHFADAQIYIPGGKHNNHFNSKDYGIDLSPRVMFAQLDLLALLIKSRVYKYLEFQSLSNFHVFENDNFKSKISNTTKEDIFTDQLMSLQTKRSLMKFLKFVLQDNNDPAKKQILIDNSKISIEEFLESSYNLKLPQVDELIYSIGLVNKKNMRTPVALARIKRFLVSFDVYGNFPVMVLKYGGPGEISQGFCRSAAVAGTTYKLDTKLKDFDPETKIAKFSDGSSVKINEKVVVAPTQIPKFLTSSYSDLELQVESYKVTRLITVVRKDCKEWMSENESSAIVVFPPESLPTNNQSAVQVIIQNGGSGVCPPGESIWYAHTCEQDGAKAKEDLESALSKMEKALLRESATNLDDVLNENDFVLSNQGTPILVNSFKLGESLQSFMPEESLDIVCKIAFVQTTYINPDLSNVLSALTATSTNISKLVVKDSEDIIFLNMPSSEVSYDGIIGEVKMLYERITGSSEDFFDVDFEDEEDEYSRGAAGAVADNEEAIEDSDYDSSHHEPFGAGEMEL
ncbi:CIC11C00000002444 [Sungouiella intermedia]|uniref:Rab proteins geranylgeranyltransferase n=1 Tax=Sungouiella intermedia TaxID=45354 RepID=A0A1L0BA38_9ASCO|nr:CIC11C00000002444 [[Candida] intermedia]